jgi:hypothetical protein
MKSIKEKAEENCIKYGSLSDIAYSEFVEGANYVLDEIEEFMKHNLVHSGNLKRLIEQLKK